MQKVIDFSDEKNNQNCLFLDALTDTKNDRHFDSGLLDESPLQMMVYVIISEPSSFTNQHLNSNIHTAIKDIDSLLFLKFGC